MNRSVISLRKLEEKDAAKMLEWMQDDSVTRFLKIDGKGKTLQDTKNFINSANTKENQHFAIVDENDEYQGTISLKNIDHVKKSAEYAIALHCDAIGKGVAAKATLLVLQIAFIDLNLDCVYLNVLQDNLRANKFYHKAGFQYTHSTDIEIHGTQKRLLWYKIDKHQFENGI